MRSLGGRAALLPPRRQRPLPHLAPGEAGMMSISPAAGDEALAIAQLLS